MKVKKTQKNKRYKKKEANNSKIGNEILGIIAFALGVLSFLAIFFPNTIGIFGNYLRTITMGISGPMAFVTPFMLSIFGIFLVFNKTSIIFKKKFAYTILLLVFVSAFYQTSSYISEDYLNMSFIDIVIKFFSDGTDLSGGGFIGGIISFPFLQLFSKLGTVVILTTLSIIDIVLLTNMSMANFFSNIGGLFKSDTKSAKQLNTRQLKIINASTNEITNYDEKIEPNTKDISPNFEKSIPRKIIDFNLEKLKWKKDSNKSDENKSNKVQQNDLINEKDEEFDLNLKNNQRNIRINELEDSFTEKKVVNEDELLSATIEEIRSETLNNVNFDTSYISNLTEDQPKRKKSVSVQNDKAEKVEISLHNTSDETYNYPTIDLLNKVTGEGTNSKSSKKAAIEGSIKLEETLKSFGVDAKVINVSRGPAVTRYELSPSPGVKVSKIVNLADDISLNLAAAGVRIEAPIPGKAAIGIEVPNKDVIPVYLKEVLESDEFKNFPSKLAFAVGKDISGETVVADIGKMPHMLVAGATGSGKSVCINSLLVSILFKASPKEVKLLMIDPKVVELGIYNGIPHLLIPVVTEPKKAAGALNWAVQEMINRYKLFADAGVRDLKGYNTSIVEEGGEALPQIVIIIDELADLMMAAPNDVEDAICRLAQMARAAGMHLVIATQRPSVDVITGVIKANIPSRIAFAVSSQVDSRTIIDMGGAEKLLGRGDMLFYPVGQPKPIRVKGAFVTDKEVERVVEYVKSIAVSEYNEDIIEEINSESTSQENNPGDNDLLLNQAIDMIVEAGQASVSLVQRKFKVGYARAARIIDQMEARGIVGRFEGSKPRQVLISKQQWQELQMSDNKGGVGQ